MMVLAHERRNSLNKGNREAFQAIPPYPESFILRHKPGVLPANISGEILGVLPVSGSGQKT